MRVGSGGRPPERTVTLNGIKLTWNKKVKHLGNIVTHDLKDTDDINCKKGVFISQVNKLKCKFCTVQSTLRGRLLQTYCCSWYGCQTWDLSGRSIGCMGIEWNKAVRRTLRLPYKTRTCLLPLLVNGKPFAVQHRSRISKFLVSFNASDNSRVSYIGERAKSYSHGALGRNYTRCRINAGVEPTPPDLLARAHAIRELMDVRDGLLVLPSVLFGDTECIINSLCCY